ncbi:MAG: efflux RND transporter periplasmic adaptor subunit [Pseudomonadota bacterium]
MTDPMTERPALSVAPRRSLWRRLGSLSLSLVLIGGAAAAGAMLVGALHSNASEERAQAASPIPVAVVPARQVERIRVETRHLGVIEPARETAMAFENGGLVAEVRVEEGDRVEAGEVLARLDLSRLDARVDELAAQKVTLEAEAELARVTLRRQAELRDRGHATDQRYDEARLTLDRIAASIAQVDAAVETLNVDRRKAVLRAPFRGEIAARFADEGAVVAGGAAVLELIEADRPQVRAGLPEALAAAQQVGRVLEIASGEDRFAAAVTAIRPDVDPATRTRAVLLDVLMPVDATIAFGRTVEVVLSEQRRESGLWVPVSALREGERGLWTLMVVGQGEDGPVASPEAVEVLHLSGDRALVRGTLADGAQVIVSGAHKLAPGVRVAPSGAEALVERGDRVALAAD